MTHIQISDSRISAMLQKWKNLTLWQFIIVCNDFCILIDKFGRPGCLERLRHDLSAIWRRLDQWRKQCRCLPSGSLYVASLTSPTMAPSSHKGVPPFLEASNKLPLSSTCSSNGPFAVTKNLQTWADFLGLNHGLESASFANPLWNASLADKWSFVADRKALAQESQNYTGCKITDPV